MREQALLDRGLGTAGGVLVPAPGRPARLVRLAGLAPGRGGQAGGGVLGVAVGLQRLGGDAALGHVAAGGGVALGHRPQPGVGVAVAVHVLDDHVAAELPGDADLLDLTVIGGHHGGALLGVDLDRAAIVAGLDHVGRVLAGLGLLDLLFLEVVGVAGAGGDREAALGQPGERPDEIGGHAGDQARAQHDGVDVPVGVVVGEDRAADVLLVARGLEVAGRGEDRVDGVVGVLLAVLVGVRPVLAPGGRHELHPAQRAGGGDVEVAPVVRLDLVDRGQDLPAHAVLDPGGLVDRQQEDRHPELADHEVGDTLGGGGAREGVDEAGVARKGGAVGPAGLGPDRRAAPRRALASLGLTLRLYWSLKLLVWLSLNLRLRLGLCAGLARIGLFPGLCRGIVVLQLPEIALWRLRSRGRRRGRRGGGGGRNVGEADRLTRHHRADVLQRGARRRVDHEVLDRTVGHTNGHVALLRGGGDRERGRQRCGQGRQQAEGVDRSLHHRGGTLPLCVSAGFRPP